MDSASSTASDQILSDSQSPSPESTNASTPFSPSVVDFPKLAALTADEVVEEVVAVVQPEQEGVKNICCVGAGYVGMSDSLITPCQVQPREA
jgi:hypothetical protein